MSILLSHIPRVNLPAPAVVISEDVEGEHSHGTALTRNSASRRIVCPPDPQKV